MTLLDRQPCLSDKIVKLRPLVQADWAPLFAVASDPEIWALHPAHDRWREAVFRSFFDEALDSKGALVIEHAQSGAMIGSSRYDLQHALPDEVEIGWTFLARSCWGGPINRAVKRLMLRHALASVEQVIFRVGDGNLRSRRALEKIGAVLTDRITEDEMAGRLVRHLVYAIDRDGFSYGPLSSEW